MKLKKKACDTHNKIGKIVRKAIKEAGGTMPEDLPTPKRSLKQLEKENNKNRIEIEQIQSGQKRKNNKNIKNY